MYRTANAGEEVRSSTDARVILERRRMEARDVKCHVLEEDMCVCDDDVFTCECVCVCVCVCA